MPWPKGHRALTRQRIVQAAAGAFRTGGISGVRVEDVMARAGLTHGGFYTYFASKDDLVRHALAHASRETVEILSKPLDGLPKEDRFRAVIDAYLSPGHVAHPEQGCPLASLGAEIARAGGTTQRTLAAGLEKRLAWTRQILGETEQDDVPDAQVIGTLACMVGGLILARLVPKKDSTAVLDACREFLHGTRGNSARSGRRQRRSGRRQRRS